MAPCVLFIDQIEALAPPRGFDTTTEQTLDRLLSLLLIQLDGVVAQHDGPPLLLLAAAHRKAQLDPAILRPGRLDVHIAIPPPDAARRRRLLARMLAATPLAADVSLDALARATDGCSLAQLSGICREAAMSALRDDLGCEAVGERHVQAALQRAGCGGGAGAMAGVDEIARCAAEMTIRE